MKPLAVPNRQAFYGAAAELAAVLKTEIARLAVDAHRLDEGGLRRFGADVRTMRQRFAGVLKLAETVLADGGASS